MKKEYHEETDATLVSFKAGQLFDDFGRPTPFWTCRVAYTWSEYRQAYWVYSVQVVGFGVADGKVTKEAEMASLREVHRYLRDFQDMETCYKQVYGE